MLDSSANLDQPLPNTSPVVLRRTTRQTSGANGTTLKRSFDHEESPQNQRKQPKLLRQALRAEVKVECPDSSNVSSLTSLPSTQLIHQSMIKTEPEIFEQNPLSRRLNLTSSSSTNSQSPLLRTLIRNSQTPSSLMTKENAPLYDLLQNHETSTKSNSFFPNNNSLDPFDQYLTPVTNNIPAKDDFLSALLNSDPQKPNEISYISTKQAEQEITNDNSRITAIANDLFNSTTLNNSSSDNFLSLVHDKEFFECLNDPSTIDSILSLNPTSFPESVMSSSSTTTTTTTTTNKRSEKDEKAINEIYKTLVTSFNPGKNLLEKTTFILIQYLVCFSGPSQPLSTVDSNNMDQNPFSTFHSFLLIHC